MNMWHRNRSAFPGAHTISEGSRSLNHASICLCLTFVQTDCRVIRADFVGTTSSALLDFKLYPGHIDPSRDTPNHGHNTYRLIDPFCYRYGQPCLARTTSRAKGCCHRRAMPLDQDMIKVPLRFWTQHHCIQSVSAIVSTNASCRRDRPFGTRFPSHYSGVVQQMM